MRLVRPAVALIMTCAALASCSLPNVGEMNFRVDDRLTFLAPQDRAMTHPPVVVRWRMRDFIPAKSGTSSPSAKAGYFAVFVDRQPIRPGQTMKAVASHDSYCQHTPSCPDATYLAQRQIYTTIRPWIRLEQISPLPGDNSRVQLHRIVVVLLNTAGERIGESSWELDLRVEQAGL